MGDAQLRLVRDPRARFWGTSIGYGLPNTLLLNWLDHPNDGEPGELMPGILWHAFAELGLTQIVFTHPQHETPGPDYRHLTAELLLAEGRQAFLGALDFDRLDSWQADQCYLALPVGYLPRRSDPELGAWQPFWAPSWKTQKQPEPTRLPEHVPLLLKVHEGEDAAWAVAFAQDTETRDAFAGALARAAEASAVSVSQPEERSMFSEDVWAKHGPAD